MSRNDVDDIGRRGKLENSQGVIPCNNITCAHHFPVKMPQPQRQPQISLSDALRNFSEAAQQLAQSWEHEYGQGAPNPFSAISVPSLPNQHAAPVEPPAKVEATAESRSTPTPEVQDMDSILQRECAVSSDMESGDEGRAQTQQDQKVCLRCFRSWKHNIQAGEDVRPCVFSQGRSGRAFKCQYCSTGRLECIAVSILLRFCSDFMTDFACRYQQVSLDL